MIEDLKLEKPKRWKQKTFYATMKLLCSFKKIEKRVLSEYYWKWEKGHHSPCGQKHPAEVFYKKAVLKSFAIFTGKYLQYKFFPVKYQLRTPILKNICERLLLKGITGTKNVLIKVMLYAFMLPNPSQIQFLFSVIKCTWNETKLYFNTILSDSIFWVKFRQFFISGNFLSKIILPCRKINKVDWLYVVTMSRTHFNVNLHSIVVWISRNSLLGTDAVSEV